MSIRKGFAQFLSMIYRQALLWSQAWTRFLPSGITKVNARVISVGNITWGGTGKTPLVAKLAKDLSHYGKKVAILIRGYGQDEVDELRKKLPNVPVIVGRDRVKSAREAIQKHGAEILILDDGFQHLRLHRDLDIVNINSTQPFGPGGLLPLGTLREPLEHLSRAQLFILTKSDIGSKNLHWIHQKIQSVKTNAVIFEAVHRPMRIVDPLRNRWISFGEMKGRKMAAISGIADPHSFEKSVENLGAEILFAARFDDHHPYTESEVDAFTKRSKELGAKDVITTEKDFFRLEPVLKKRGSLGIDFWVLQIEFQVSDEEDLIRRCLNP